MFENYWAKKNIGLEKVATVVEINVVVEDWIYLKSCFKNVMTLTLVTIKPFGKMTDISFFAPGEGRLQSTLFAFSTTATLFQVQTSSKFVTR